MSTAPLIYDDTALLASLAAGDEAAFNTLFERYREKLYHYLLKITKSREISEEIVIDIFVKLWMGRELMDHIRQLENFLHKVAYHKAIDFLKTTSRHAHLQKAYIERIVPEPEKGADELLVDAEFRQILREAVHQLPPQRKLIYTLSREQGLTHDQIAAALHLSPNTVKNSMMAATKSIRIFLHKYSPGKAAFFLSIFL